MNIYFIINPIAGKNQSIRKISLLIDRLNTEYPDAFIHFTESKGEGRKIAESLKGDVVKLIICGGDGTINEIVNGLGPYSSPIIDIFPIGSGNDLSRELNINNNIEELIKRIQDDEYRIIDLGEIVLTDDENRSVKQIFCSSCGIGFDALAAHFSNKNTKLKGLLLYLSSAFSALRNYSNSRLSGHIDGQSIRFNSMMVSIGNGKTSGGGFKLLPFAQVDDGKLDLSIINYLNRLKILFYLPIAIFGKHTKMKIVNYSKFESCSIQLDPGNYIHTDGEVISMNGIKVEIRVLKNALKIKV